MKSAKVVVETSQGDFCEPSRNAGTGKACRAAARFASIGDIPKCAAHYVAGDEFVVSKLKLVLNVNAPASARQAYERFFQIAALLLNAAIPGGVRNEKTLDLQVDDPPLILNGYALALIRTDWPNGIQGGHDLAFTVEIADLPSAMPALL